jgi:hypothetical protein
MNARNRITLSLVMTLGLILVTAGASFAQSCDFGACGTQCCGHFGDSCDSNDQCVCESGVFCGTDCCPDATDTCDNDVCVPQESCAYGSCGTQCCGHSGDSCDTNDQCVCESGVFCGTDCCPNATDTCDNDVCVPQESCAYGSCGTQCCGHSGDSCDSNDQCVCESGVFCGTDCCPNATDTCDNDACVPQTGVTCAYGACGTQCCGHSGDACDSNDQCVCESGVFCGTACCANATDTCDPNGNCTTGTTSQGCGNGTTICSDVFGDAACCGVPTDRGSCAAACSPLVSACQDACSTSSHPKRCRKRCRRSILGSCRNAMPHVCGE